MYRLLSKEYGWTPEQISEMTIGQIHYYLMPEDEARRIDTGRLDEANALLARLGEEQRKADKKARRRKQ